MNTLANGASIKEYKDDIDIAEITKQLKFLDNPGNTVFNQEGKIFFRKIEL